MATTLQKSLLVVKKQKVRTGMGRVCWMCRARSTGGVGVWGLLWECRGKVCGGVGQDLRGCGG
jgi:hypothetical protein